MNLSLFFQTQLAEWPEVAARFNDLSRVETRKLGTMDAQFNPARMVSTGAKVDKKTIARRPCFLCKRNRPAIQRELPFDGDFDILVNPFPILPIHFTIAAKAHRPQSILDHYATLYRLAEQQEGTLFFYNGPKCGASAPDHLHFQGGDGQVVPLFRDWDTWAEKLLTLTRLDACNRICTLDGYPIPILAIVAREEEKAATLFRRVYAALPCHDEDTEPMLNALAWKHGQSVVTIIFPREKHRPNCYYSENPEEKMLISPGALDMAGLVITPRKEDFERLTPPLLASIIGEVALSRSAFTDVTQRLGEPTVAVGIISAPEIAFSLQGTFMADGGLWTGEQRVRIGNGKIIWRENEYDTLTFAPHSPHASFTLSEVTIGVGFHWERKEAETFEGLLRLEQDGIRLLVINELPVERYLRSVISSEMSSTSSLSLLQAHAVISRSWLLSQMAHRIDGDTHNSTTEGWETDEERIRWYDRDDHTRFDVCADDHCQRYQGITRIVSERVDEAIRSTYGKVLWDGTAICDARFSKCCGGATELFSSCWQNEDKPYLAAFRDIAAQGVGDTAALPDLTVEENARRWILTSPSAFCNTQDKGILGQVLNGYDQETADFYRWTADYTQEELRSLIERKTGLKFGHIIDLIPMERGKSGRLIRLKIVGQERSLIIGKELEIRRTLSETHLKSSAFVVERRECVDGIPQGFRLLGAGWGHGVGLCQIGAAMMGAKGYDYASILRHYYPGATLHTRYEPWTTPREPRKEQKNHEQ